MKYTCQQCIWGILRLSMGWIFIWAFLDKLFGLGFATESEKAWINGGSPTLGFLKFGTDGPLATMYQSMAGNVFVDWLFMLGLALIGLALLLGVGVRIAGYTGSLLMLLMWSASLPPSNNPFMDEHIIYILVLIGLTVTHAGQYFGFGTWWENTKLVQRYSIFK